MKYVRVFLAFANRPRPISSSKNAWSQDDEVIVTDLSQLLLGESLAPIGLPHMHVSHSIRHKRYCAYEPGIRNNGFRVGVEGLREMPLGQELWHIHKCEWVPHGKVDQSLFAAWNSRLASGIDYIAGTKF